eukprot:CAMPEP_0170480904 /NCGR_PEP_ID=MMETSP0208-20121228/1555_1 /TAXON_ID=197538 /ORGANISM="Strombidium inclinatum, Strain S3" /LENGTH=174 /DNA_ID=CAMNT_0010753519 /DNA_START=163 /DNA_END=687 /DNA_ORIENTATION=-
MFDLVREDFVGQWHEVRREPADMFTLWIQWSLCPTKFFNFFPPGGMTMTTVSKLWLFNWTMVNTQVLYKNFWIFNGWGIFGDKWVRDEIYNLFDEQYQIIDTDYRNYAVVYGCTDHGWFLWHTYHASLLSKKDWLDEVYLSIASNVLREVGYSTQKLWTKKTDPSCEFGVVGDH